MAFKRGALMAKVEASTLKKEEDRKQIAAFKVGDTIDVHQWILEGYDKEGNEKRRIQIYSGTVIAMKSGRKIICPVELALPRIPRASPRLATNQRLPMVAVRTEPTPPAPSPTMTPQTRKNCQN